jgi:hypothetical protein
MSNDWKLAEANCDTVPLRSFGGGDGQERLITTLVFVKDVPAGTLNGLVKEELAPAVEAFRQKSNATQEGRRVADLESQRAELLRDADIKAAEIDGRSWKLETLLKTPGPDTREKTALLDAEIVGLKTTMQGAQRQAKRVEHALAEAREDFRGILERAHANAKQALRKTVVRTDEELQEKIQKAAAVLQEFVINKAVLQAIDAGFRLVPEIPQAPPVERFLGELQNTF